MTADPTGAPANGAASRYALSARPGRVSSWLRKFAANPTSSAPESFREAARPTSGMPISLTTPVVRRLPRCARKPRSPPLQRSSASPIAATAATARPPRTLGDPEAAAAALRKGRDRKVAVSSRQLRQVAHEIGVDQEEPARGRRAFRERQRLPLAAGRKAENPRAGPLRLRRRPVPGAVVGDDHLDRKSTR